MFDKFSFSNIWENDGIFISVVGYLIVFAALLILSIIITYFQKILISRQRRKLKSVGHRAADAENLEISGEISAAISMAIYLHFQENHDIENTVLTIKRVQRTYSPWSSKLYGLREYPKR
ncbi:MAG: OadG family protein [Bacteroidetes bacterium]|nr:OadG family protein [Bacteroidota bacterium]MBU1117008.1 OadG family protein [Bacteroidota bacterium]MBU1799724.1 OadG family protein [Bacteroidota bacterium]